jgi:hypothetical protein
MKTVEINHNNDWLDRLLNNWPFLVDSEQVKTLFAFAYCKEGKEWRWYRDDTSLFNNGTVFVRYTVSPVTSIFWGIGAFLAVVFSAWWLLLFTFGLFVHLSWRETGDRRYIQLGWGHKLNGRVGTPFRIPKNDEQSAKGAHESAPNSGQASKWQCGTK